VHKCLAIGGTTNKSRVGAPDGRRRALCRVLRASEEFKKPADWPVAGIASRLLDLEGRLVFMNEGGKQVLEICDVAPFLNNSWIDFWEGEDREAARAAVEAARAGNMGRFVGYFATRITGQPRWWDIVVSPILDARGEPERLLALSRDVTEHKQNEKALREAHQFNKEIIQGAAEGHHRLRLRTALPGI